MPLYEYECEACGERFELIRRFSDPPVEVCTRCGKGPVTRLFSSPAIQFKGTGFYITDYAKKGEGGKGEGGQGEGGKEGASEKTSTEKTQDARSDAAAADKGPKTERKSDTAGKSDASAKSDTPAKSSGPPPATGSAKD
jgi:putative FmdB family regulatory protein